MSREHGRPSEVLFTAHCPRSAFRYRGPAHYLIDLRQQFVLLDRLEQMCVDPQFAVPVPVAGAVPRAQQDDAGGGQLGPLADPGGQRQAVRERVRAVGGHLPIIALTARSRKEDRERCLAAGMDDFLTKPVSAADLLTAIDRLAPAPGVSRPVQPATAEPVSLLDPVAVLTACGDDEEALRGMCRAFQTYVPERLAEVGDALRGKDAPRLREAAHKLCALLYAFSTAAGDVASDLEDHAAQGRLEEARPLVEQLETMARELLGLADGLSIETLRHQAAAAGDREQAVGS